MQIRALNVQSDVAIRLILHNEKDNSRACPQLPQKFPQARKGVILDHKTQRPFFKEGPGVRRMGGLPLSERQACWPRRYGERHWSSERELKAHWRARGFQPSRYRLPALPW